MKIYFAGIQLTDWQDYPAQAVSVNGETVFEAVDIVRALAKKYIARGNQGVSLSFSVRREFATLREAQVYLLTHFTTLPKSGICSIICGGDGPDADTAEVLLNNAVLTASPSGTMNGVSVTVAYTIQAGSASTEFPPDFLIGGETVILRSKQAIDNGATSVAVVFGVSFPPGTTVIVNANVAKPGATGANIFATVRDDLTTVDGFTAELSGPTPDANHKLTWSAIGT